MLLKCTTNSDENSSSTSSGSRGAGENDAENSVIVDRSGSDSRNSNSNSSGSSSSNNSNNSNSNSGTGSSTAMTRGTGIVSTSDLEPPCKRMRMTMATSSTMTPRVHRKGFRIPSKRHPGKALPGKLHSISRIGPGKIPPGKRIPQRPQPPPCDNSNDSGFGFDQHVEVQNSNQHMIRTMPQSRSTRIDVEQHDEICTDDSDETYNTIPNNNNNNSSIHSRPQYRAKRKKIESVVDLDNDDACSEDAFISRIASATATATHNQAVSNPPIAPSKYISNGVRAVARVGHKRQPVAALNNVATSSNGRVQLEIISQPEQQHRARYQTEGSRGAVKDRSGNGFPIVRLVGYNKPSVLQVFIGTDIGRVAPHMFYQACKVAGKNSTQCNEKKIDGTMIIEIDFKPESDMTITCDCVGILKERNVDVEHRFPDHLAQKSKKKSTRCRMVFRTQLSHDDGTVETLQVCSNQIICTQPPGVPEICKKSLDSCPVDGGLELFIIGKNFLKDTRVLFQETLEDLRTSNELVPIGSLWEASVLPDKEYLQQTHLICTVPPYIHQNILKPVTVQLSIISSGRKSESHNFTYTPKGTYTTLSAATTLSTLHGSMSGQDTRYMDTSVVQPCSSNVAANAAVVQQMWNETKHEIDADMMPPPTSTQIPMNVRRSSLTNAMITDQIVQINGLKTEIIDENSQNSIADAMQSDSLDRFPVVTNDNGLVTDANPLKEVMQYQRIRKQSIDMLDMRSMSLLSESNSLPSFPTHHNDMNAVEIAVKNEQIAKEILTVAAVHQGQHTVDKFLSSLSPTIANIKSGPPMEQNSMFVSSTGGSSGVIFPAQATNSMVVASNPTNSIDQTLSNILAAANHSPPSDMQSSMPLVRTSSVSSTASSSSSSSSESNKSPIMHDIILNSEPAAAITSVVNMQQVLTGDETTAPTDHIPAEMILNSNVSPTTILCPPNGVPNLIAEQVSLLNGIRMPQQATQDSILSTIIMTPQSNSPPTQQQSAGQSQQQVQPQTSPRQASAAVQRQDSQVTATSTAVSNMIIKAAADFISNHENNPESTISALMGLNTSPIQTQSQVSQMLASPVTTNSLVPNPSPGMCSTTQFLANNNRHHQLMEPRQQETVPLVNMLLNHEVQNVPGPTGTANVQSQFLQGLQKTNQMALSVTPQTNQESLIQVALAETALQKSNANVAQQQINNILPPNVSLTDPPATVPIPSTAASIPQELTTMSDQDLISYINPSTFDQI